MADLKGLKRICMSCGARFYDLNKKPIVCPNCSTEFTGEIKVKSRRGRLPIDDAVPGPIDEEEVVVEEVAAETEEIEADEETVSLDEIEEAADDEEEDALVIEEDDLVIDDLDDDIDDDEIEEDIAEDEEK